jgi:ubiquinone/menaquinone biosynthesis C-methylase UbiE
MQNIPERQPIVKCFASKGIFPSRMAFTLLIPLRNIFLSPKELIKRLELSDDSLVLEVGPGPGYFSIKVAAILTRGSLTLADIQQEMLDYARKRIDKKGLTNVRYHLCNGKTFDFPDHLFDRIFMITVIGEVENKEAYLKEFFRIMRPGGILSISELAGDPDKLSTSQVRVLLQNSGFEFYRMYGNEKNYTLNFIKK